MIQRIKEKIKLNTVIRLIPTALFLVFIIEMAVPTFFNETVKDTVKATEVSFYGVEQLSDKFEGVLQENFYDKNEYVNLNGLTARILGINSLNERYKLANGYLARADDAKDVTEYSNSVIELNKFLLERGIDFLYIQVPSKEAFYDVEYLPGYSSNGRETIESMVSSLTKAGVNTLDMNAWFKDNGWSMEEVFFKTDHHWKPEAGLATARATMDILEDNGKAFYSKDLLNDSNYDNMVLKDWFLGSSGKRVGIYFAGVDDINVYFPKFPTNYSFARLSKDTNAWAYTDSLLNLTYLDKKDYFGSDPTGIYLYANNPLQIIKNTEAINDKKVLTIGDSFIHSWQYFLTTQFKEVYSMDLRYYKDGTFVQYVEEVQPDIVIILLNPSGMVDKSYAYGIAEYADVLNFQNEKDKNVNVIGDISFEAKEDSKSKFRNIYNGLEPGKTYTLMLGSTYYSGDDESFVQMTLQDLSTNESVYNRYFDANSNETQKWIFTVPGSEDKSDHIYAIYLYAGTKEHYVDSIKDEEDKKVDIDNIKPVFPEPVTVEVNGIYIQEGIIED